MKRVLASLIATPLLGVPVTALAGCENGQCAPTSRFGDSIKSSRPGQEIRPSASSKSEGIADRGSAWTLVVKAEDRKRVRRKGKPISKKKRQKKSTAAPRRSG